ncbi:hypothetical protein ACQP3C_29600, partial [Escherichia coli]
MLTSGQDHTEQIPTFENELTKNLEIIMVVHAFKYSTLEVEAGGTVSLVLDKCTLQIPWCCDHLDQ